MKVKTDKKAFVKNRQSGFTLVEIAIVSLIFGFFITGAVLVYDNYKDFTFRMDTNENIGSVNNEIAVFYGSTGRLPLPADPTLGPDDANFGESIAAFPVTSCPGTVNNIVCTNIGGHDADGDGTNDFVLIGAVPVTTLNQFKDFNTSEFLIDHGLDGNKNKLLYAVTHEMTLPIYDLSRPASANLGAVVVWDENGNPIADPTHPTNPDLSINAAQYLVLSYGQNGRGAYTVEGNRVGDCNVSTGTLAGGASAPGFLGDDEGDGSGNTIDIEIENCDNNDAIFMSALKSDTNRQLHYDDFIRPKILSESVLWRPAATPPVVGVGTPAATLPLTASPGGNPVGSQCVVAVDNGQPCYKITATGIDTYTNCSCAIPAGQIWLYNTNAGGVEIGSGDQDVSTAVVGTALEIVAVDSDGMPGTTDVAIRAETELQVANGYCESAEGGTDDMDCFSPELFAGNPNDADAITEGRSCSDGEVAVGIEDGALICVPLFNGPIIFECQLEDPLLPLGDTTISAGNDQNSNGVNDQTFPTSIKIRRDWNANSATSVQEVECQTL